MYAALVLRSAVDTQHNNQSLVYTTHLKCIYTGTNTHLKCIYTGGTNALVERFIVREQIRESSNRFVPEVLRDLLCHRLVIGIHVQKVPDSSQ
jgi:hypothetical protein